MIGFGISLANGGYPVERVNPLPVPATLIVIVLEFQPCGARPVKGLADGSGVYEDSVSVLVRILEVVEVDVIVLKLSMSAGDVGEASWTGITVTADVSTTKDAVAGGVLPPSQTVEPSCSAKEYGP